MAASRAVVVALLRYGAIPDLINYARCSRATASAVKSLMASSPAPFAFLNADIEGRTAILRSLDALEPNKCIDYFNAFAGSDWSSVAGALVFLLALQLENNNIWLLYSVSEDPQAARQMASAMMRALPTLRAMCGDHAAARVWLAAVIDLGWADLCSGLAMLDANAPHPLVRREAVLWMAEAHFNPRMSVTADTARLLLEADATVFLYVFTRRTFAASESDTRLAQIAPFVQHMLAQPVLIADTLHVLERSAEDDWVYHQAIAAAALLHRESPQACPSHILGATLQPAVKARAARWEPIETHRCREWATVIVAGRGGISFREMGALANIWAIQ